MSISSIILFLTVIFNSDKRLIQYFEPLTYMKINAPLCQINTKILTTQDFIDYIRCDLTVKNIPYFEQLFLMNNPQFIQVAFQVFMLRHQIAAFVDITIDQKTFKDQSRSFIEYIKLELITQHLLKEISKSIKSEEYTANKYIKILDFSNRSLKIHEELQYLLSTDSPIIMEFINKHSCSSHVTSIVISMDSAPAILQQLYNDDKLKQNMAITVTEGELIHTYLILELDPDLEIEIMNKAQERLLTMVQKAITEKRIFIKIYRDGCARVGIKYDNAKKYVTNNKIQ